MDSNANNPGEFWKTLNTIKKRDNKDPSSNIILFKRNCLTILKKLMNMNYTNNFNINNIPRELQSFELLNKEILAEVVLALRCLKNKKSCGPVVRRPISPRTH